MHRRPFILGSLAGILMNQTSTKNLSAENKRLDAAAACLERSVQLGQVESAVIAARAGDQQIEKAFGSAGLDSAFLLGSISKPICVTALMTLFDQRQFELNSPAQKFLPEFRGEGREHVTVLHLLTHTSGLPDQLPNNADLRRNHASLSTFTEAAMRVPLGFSPGTKYEYSSMAILLATEIAQRIAGVPIAQLVDDTVLKPLGMQHSALGLGTIPINNTIAVQTEHAAPEAGGGDPTAKLWDWNSRYWRELGAPWGGVHASASDVLKFLSSFVNEDKFLKPETKQLMIRNHNPNDLVPRGLGFALGPAISKHCTSTAFGHTGSTGTIAFFDIERDISCVVLTSLPGQAIQPHPRELAAECL